MINIRNATFRQLQVFEAVARHASFTVAAEELHLTQPTLSMQIKKLTDIVGMPLYNQIGKRIHLTEVGRELLETTQSIFNTLSGFQMKVADIKGVKKGNLRLSGVTTAEYFAPRILGAFCKKYPGITVALEVTNRQRILERLENNMDDIYIVGQAPTSPHIYSLPFLENPLVILAPPSHPLAGHKNIPIGALAHENFIMREPGCGTFLSMDKLIQDQNFSFNSSMALGSNEAIKQAVIGELGISLLSIYALSHEISTGELVVLDIEGFPIKDQWYLCYPEGKQLSIVAQVFFDYMLNEGRELTLSTLPPATAVPGNTEKTLF
jgi:DNA-binding transcriptional LysR family regulator